MTSVIFDQGAAGAVPWPVSTGLTQPTTPADTQPVSGTVSVDNLPAPQTDALTDSELRASPIATRDDYATGEILADQTGAGAALEFTFSSAVDSAWVYAVNASDLEDSGEVRVDPFGGTPSASFGIPVPYGSAFPITAPLSSLKVFAASGIRVTVVGYRR